MVPAWGITSVFAVLAVFSTERIRFLTLALVIGMLATFLLQLATRTPAGFVERARVSISGVVGIVAIAALTGLLIDAFR